MSLRDAASHPLDQPIWTTLTTTQQKLAEGYGQILLSAISRQIVSRGGIPFLHVFSSNHSAIALYRRQGMEIRRRFHVTVLRKSD